MVDKTFTCANRQRLKVSFVLFISLFQFVLLLFNVYSLFIICAFFGMFFLGFKQFVHVSCAYILSFLNVFSLSVIVLVCLNSICTFLVHYIVLCACISPYNFFFFYLPLLYLFCSICGTLTQNVVFVYLFLHSNKF
jgi:hypothetical protein